MIECGAEVMTMPTLELTEEQGIELVKQLPSCFPLALLPQAGEAHHLWALHPLLFHPCTGQGTDSASLMPR